MRTPNNTHSTAITRRMREVRGRTARACIRELYQFSGAPKHLFHTLLLVEFRHDVNRRGACEGTAVETSTRKGIGSLCVDDARSLGRGRGASLAGASPSLPVAIGTAHRTRLHVGSAPENAGNIAGFDERGADDNVAGWCRCQRASTCETPPRARLR